ncbi:MAG: cell wall hydrolase [Lachnospiraceae bacterium]|nr:cell wall hydrolase [Lachnospiraceae bacterium]
MKSGIAARIAAIPVISILVYGMSVRGSAAQVVDRLVLEEAAAGAAEYVEFNIEPTPEEVAEIIAQNNVWKNPGSIVMADVYSSVNVRTEPSEEAELAGKLYKDCGGYILEYTDSWTKIESGRLVGWVRNDYLMFGEEAKANAEEVGSYRATVNTTTLRVRTEPSTEASCSGMVAEGDVYEVVSQEDGWVAIDFEGDNGYINTEYADISFHIDYGETMQAIEAREAAEKKAREEAAAAQARAAAATAAAKREADRNQYYGVYAADASDVVLLGALIQCEAGNQPYEGKVAVGAVVMNRLRSAAYPNTLYGVIYASHQFSPAGCGALDRRIAKGVDQSCLQAAQEALNGRSNVGNATHFRRTGAHDGIVIAGHVFW